MDGREIEWAREEFGHVELGDRRREDRCIRMAATLAASPAGRVSDVFARAAERQGAYDFLENRAIGASSLSAAVSKATAVRCQGQDRCLVVIDGTSLRIADWTGKKDFGVVGSYRNDARGLKVISALAMTPEGELLGLLAQHYWTRPTTRPPRIRPMYRDLETKETRFWLQVIDEVRTHVGDTTRVCVVIDREGDCCDILLKLAQTRTDFVIRSRHDRRLAGSRKSYLVSKLKRQNVLFEYELDVAAGHERQARRAKMRVRTTQVTLDFYDHYTKKHRYLDVWAVLTEERSNSTPAGEKPIQWLVLSNQPAATETQAQEILRAYTCRWTIEEFHKTWKSGQCSIESTQLHSTEAVRKWATLHAAVAARTERLKNLARTSPNEPASTELTDTEIRVLVALKHRIKNRVELVPDTPTIEQAVTWIAQLGGYTGKSSGGPPGSITIARGFEKLQTSVQAVAAFEHLKKLR